MARAAHVGGAAFFVELVSTHFVAQIVPLAVLRDDLIAEFVIQAFGREIALLFRHPFLQTHMGRYDELGHAKSPCGALVPLYSPLCGPEGPTAMVRNGRLRDRSE